MCVASRASKVVEQEEAHQLLEKRCTILAKASSTTTCDGERKREKRTSLADLLSPPNTGRERRNDARGEEKRVDPRGRTIPSPTERRADISSMGGIWPSSLLYARVRGSEDNDKDVRSVVIKEGKTQHERNNKRVKATHVQERSAGVLCAERNRMRQKKEKERKKEH